MVTSIGIYFRLKVQVIIYHLSYYYTEFSGYFTGYKLVIGELGCLMMSLFFTLLSTSHCFFYFFSFCHDLGVADQAGLNQTLVVAW